MNIIETYAKRWSVTLHNINLFMVNFYENVNVSFNKFFFFLLTNLSNEQSTSLYKNLHTL